MAIAGSQPLRIAATVSLAYNSAGSGGAVCALSGSQNRRSTFAIGMISSQLLSESPNSCQSGIETFAESLDAKCLFMINLHGGAHLTVSASRPHSMFDTI